jgi:hypothetical protein
MITALLILLLILFVLAFIFLSKNENAIKKVKGKNFKKFVSAECVGYTKAPERRARVPSFMTNFITN